MIYGPTGVLDAAGPIDLRGIEEARNNSAAVAVELAAALTADAARSRWDRLEPISTDWSSAAFALPIVPRLQALEGDRDLLQSGQGMSVTIAGSLQFNARRFAGAETLCGDDPPVAYVVLHLSSQSFDHLGPSFLLRFHQHSLLGEKLRVEGFGSTCGGHASSMRPTGLVRHGQKTQ